MRREADLGVLELEMIEATIEHMMKAEMIEEEKEAMIGEMTIVADTTEGKEVEKEAEKEVEKEEITTAGGIEEIEAMTGGTEENEAMTGGTDTIDGQANRFGMNIQHQKTM